MISGLTFKQENTIADEPIVDLSIYLNNMLDAAASKVRQPSGNNSLQWFVLIVGGGRFHEKENLKHWVTDVLGKKRMVAFLLLDNLQESIIDLKESSFQGKEIKVYIDSFLFPYYIVLRNIEVLPRTLADLLRHVILFIGESLRSWFSSSSYTKGSAFLLQWFEVVQNTRD